MTQVAGADGNDWDEDDSPVQGSVPQDCSLLTLNQASKTGCCISRDYPKENN